MKILNGIVSKRGSKFPGLILTLKEKFNGKNHAVINSGTIGFMKTINWSIGDYVSIPVVYKIGPDAIYIKEII